MKNVHFICLIFLLMIVGACSSNESELAGWDIFGEQISLENAVSVSEVINQFVLDEEKEFKISGELTTVCQEKGCWTILETEDDRNIRMTFHNYSFFLPIDAAGRTVIAEGVGLKKETSVNELRHYAKDAQKSEEEILAITEPKIEYLFEARGVLLK